MTSVIEHQQAADAVLAAKDAAGSDDERATLHQAWSLHTTAALQTKISAQKQAAAALYRRAEASARTPAQTAAQRELAEKLEHASMYLIERAEINSAQGHEIVRGRIAASGMEKE